MWLEHRDVWQGCLCKFRYYKLCAFKLACSPTDVHYLISVIDSFLLALEMSSSTSTAAAVDDDDVSCSSPPEN